MHAPHSHHQTFNAAEAAPLLKAGAIVLAISICFLELGHWIYGLTWPVSAQTIQTASENACVRELVVGRVVDTTPDELSSFKRFCDNAEEDARKARARRRAQEAVASREPQK